MLRETPILLIDCQTTGMRPSNGSLLEISWAWLKASDETEPEIHSYLVRLPDGLTIPERVVAITGICDADLAQALSPDEVREKLKHSLSEASLQTSPLTRATAVIHYAQFEKPWLENLFGGETPFDIVCSYKLSKKLFPNLPSSNIRGVSGFFGGRVGEIKRAASHVKATVSIWRGLAKELEARGVNEIHELAAWMKDAPKTKPARYEYRVEKEKRLALPDRPGIYRMISKSGEILYVGKATSLKDRVNSYFRGKRGRDKRKLELMAQVWDLRITETRTAVEAALLESDEIKKYDPPYNVSLKSGRRRLVYYSRDLMSLSEAQDETHSLGPFRRFNNIERVVMLAQVLRTGRWTQVFYDVVEPEDLETGFAAFLARHKLEKASLADTRKLLAVGIKLLRKIAPEVAEADAETEPTPTEDEALTPEEMADKFERLLTRAAWELHRAKAMTRLLDARVRWQSPEGWVDLEVHRGRIGAGDIEKPRFPWQGLDVADYDRMSILASELVKYPHEIEKI